MARTVVAVQVVPVIESICDEVLATPQLAGPDENTSFWAIYERLEDGTASWVADARDETHAMLFGEQLAAFHEVQIEPQPWKPKPEPEPEQRYYVSWHIDVDAVSPEAAARKALEYQRNPNSRATLFDVVDDIGGVPERIDLTTIDEERASQ